MFAQAARKDQHVATICTPSAESRAAADLDVRSFRAGNEPAILTLFHRVFGRDSPGFPPRTLAHWRWEFDGAPMGRRIFVATLGNSASV